MSQEIRTFVAIELPDVLKAELGELQASLKRQTPPHAVRWSSPEGMHLTLKFLGQTPANQIEDLSTALEVACASFPPFSYAAGVLGCFPNLQRLRVIWVGIQDPSGILADLQSAVEEACFELGFEREQRAFHPHLTLGRVQRAATADDIRAISSLIQQMPAASSDMVTARGVSLIRSDLQPTGAVYTTLREFELTEG